MAEAVLGLGGNLGARSANLRCALALLADTPGCEVLARSALYETPPLGPPQPDYYNAAARVRWHGAPRALLARTQEIEQRLGRVRSLHWGPRTLDIDLLHWSDGPVREDGLTLPHPELEARAFALAPLLDVAPALAPQFRARLAALGGPPPRARRGWLEPACDGDDWVTPWLDDPSELTALIPELFACIQPPPACASHTRAFEGPSALVDEAGRFWLEQCVREAVHDGFAATRAAVLEAQPGRLRGVLLGAAVDARHALPPCAARLEVRDDGARRVRLCRGAPDGGFALSESITM
ncbi:MAG: 2-amino-4-hydroxy-6-hydroxymethyldihydropteridine diphosphokinase [Polyangiales bacterium]